MLAHRLDPAAELPVLVRQLGDPVVELGELVVKGPQVMLGYWNRPEETAQTVRDGWLYTGDLAYMDEDGYFFIMDRKKDLVLVGGYNVYPREVDEVLMAHPDIQEPITDLNKMTSKEPLFHSVNINYIPPILGRVSQPSLAIFRIK